MHPRMIKKKSFDEKHAPQARSSMKKIFNQTNAPQAGFFDLVLMGTLSY